MEPLTHKSVVDIAYRWLLKNTSCGIAFKELYSSASNGEYPDVIGFGAWGHSVLIEVKVSRSDFLKDKYKPFRKNPALGMGSQRFYCCPKGMIKPEELPEGWGLLYVEKKRCKTFYSPYTGNIGERLIANEKNVVAEHGLMYSALRRLFIKGYVKHIYDKQYNRDSNPVDLITINEPDDTREETEVPEPIHGAVHPQPCEESEGATAE